MLFAVIPLRNALPGSPPFGGWIDITIVLWVLVVLVISMLLYINCWWRHLRPDNPTNTDAPANPAPSPPSSFPVRACLPPKSYGATPSMRKLTPWRMHRCGRDCAAWGSRCAILSSARR